MDFLHSKVNKREDVVPGTLKQVFTFALVVEVDPAIFTQIEAAGITYKLGEDVSICADVDGRDTFGFGFLHLSNNYLFWFG